MIKLLGKVLGRRGYPDLAVLEYIDVEVFCRREKDGLWVVTSIKRL